MKVEIIDDFWNKRLELNKKEALIYQWSQYEKCGTIENFRIVAQNKHKNRRGFFYTDSDLHKWADAVSRVLLIDSDKTLKNLLDEYISLVSKVQTDEGYIYTWNQIYYPQKRWINIHIEHELYTMGHFIEAGISHFLVTDKKILFNLAIKAADLIVKDFSKINYSNCPGHQEIEIALLKLYQITKDKKYLNTADKFLRKRGNGKLFGIKLLFNLISHNLRNKHIKKIDGREKSKEKGFDFVENIQESEPRFLAIRSFWSFISGKYHQQHRALLKQTTPEGHAVRWTYMMYAVAILNNEKSDPDLELVMAENWKNLISKKMYITGGIGSLPVIEGFGRNYELNNKFSYSETCAAIGSIFWHNEMLKSSKLATFADMIERQLYNAALVGISQDGKKYLYRNPLESCGSLERRPWFATACCPSNISRLWADIHKLIYLEDGSTIYVNQYIGSKTWLNESKTEIEISSEFPWAGKVQLKVSTESIIRIKLRIPGWAESCDISVNNKLYSKKELLKKQSRIYTETMDASEYIEVKLNAGKNQTIEVEFPMSIIKNKSDYLVKDNRGMFAVSRGPLIYCVESDLEHTAPVDVESLSFEYDYNSFSSKTGFLTNSDIKLIPYFLWGNSGKKYMKVWLSEK